MVTALYKVMVVEDGVQIKFGRGRTGRYTKVTDQGRLTGKD